MINLNHNYFYDCPEFQECARNSDYTGHDFYCNECDYYLCDEDVHNEFLTFVTETIHNKYNCTILEASEIVNKSFLPKSLKEMPDYILHYDEEYWADEIMKDRRTT